MTNGFGTSSHIRPIYRVVHLFYVPLEVLALPPFSTVIEGRLQLRDRVSFSPVAKLDPVRVFRLEILNF